MDCLFVTVLFFNKEYQNTPDKNTFPEKDIPFLKNKTAVTTTVLLYLKFFFKLLD